MYILQVKFSVDTANTVEDILKVQNPIRQSFEFTLHYIVKASNAINIGTVGSIFTCKPQPCIHVYSHIKG